MAGDDHGSSGTGPGGGGLGGPPPGMSIIQQRALNDYEDPIAMGRVSADIDSSSRFYDLEDRVSQWWVDYGLTLGAGVPGVLILVGSLFIPELDRATGNHLGDYQGWIRLGMMLLAAYLIFLGWPRRTRRGETVEQADAEREAMERLHDDFHRRFRR